MAVSELVTDKNIGVKKALASGDDLNDLYGPENTGVYVIQSGVSHAPETWTYLLIISSGDMTCQIVFGKDNIYERRRQGNPPSFNGWRSCALTAI